MEEIDRTAWIETVMDQGESWLVNGVKFIPKAQVGGQASQVQQWIDEGGQVTYPHVPTPEEELQAWRENGKVGPLQIRRALRAMGEMETVKTYMETQATEEEQEAWEYATVIPRLDPLVVGLQGILERTDEEVDQLFELALTFP